LLSGFPRNPGTAQRLPFQAPSKSTGWETLTPAAGSAALARPVSSNRKIACPSTSSGP
jgi:hypothetical protein